MIWQGPHCLCTLSDEQQDLAAGFEEALRGASKKWPLGGLLESDDSRNPGKEVCRLRSFGAQYGVCTCDLPGPSQLVLMSA